MPVRSSLAAPAALVLSALALLGPAPARADGTDIAADALVHDLEKIVEYQSSIGWKIDKYEYEKMMPDALLSVCRSTDEARLRALGDIDQRIDALGGPLEEAYRANNNSLSGLKELQFVTRIRALLEEASRRASSECPLGMDPDPTFKGLQTDAGRWTISVEGGGLFTLQRANPGGYQFGGGGSGRLLLGRGINQHWTILAGAELGGTALFDQTDKGTNFPLQFTGALPVVLRRHWVTWHFDFEMAPIAFATGDDYTVSPGGRLGILLGVSTLRIRGIMPWAGVGLAGEYISKAEHRPSRAVAKGGLRVGFDWDY